MQYIFGPVPSRRLGLSLGVDLIPPKTCSYDCLYCQVGRTTDKQIEPAPFISVEEVLKELERVLEKSRPDTITLAGSGEPTLHGEIDRVITRIKELTDTRVALLTNGSLLWSKAIRDRILGADIILPTLSTVFEETFRAMHRPHRDLELIKIIEGIKNLRKDYSGLIFIEVVLLAGYNDREKELEALGKVFEEISPDKIQLNTVVRPPSDARAQALDRTRLERIRDFFGQKAEIIAPSTRSPSAAGIDSRVSSVVEMARRRPVRAVDISNSLHIPLEETERMMKGMVLKGRVKLKEHGGEKFYVA
jgi:wyosine [tRNA(Phe)-imidazoG37] synthetase (radical SAM superfamily)